MSDILRLRVDQPGSESHVAWRRPRRPNAISRKNHASESGSRCWQKTDGPSVSARGPEVAAASPGLGLSTNTQRSSFSFNPFAQALKIPDHSLSIGLNADVFDSYELRAAHSHPA